MNTKPISLEELTYALDRFAGSLNCYEYRPGTLLTDGTKFLLEMTNCHWLIDRIADAQTKTFLRKADGLQSWTACVHKDNSATLVCTNGRDRTIYREVIAHTYFVLGQSEPLKIFAGLAGDSQSVIIMLPSEK